MAMDPMAVIQQALGIASTTVADTRAELDRAQSDYQRAVDDPAWATVHGTTVAELKTRVEGITWRLGRDQAAVDQLSSMLPPIQDGRAALPPAETASTPVAPSDALPRTVSPDPKPGDPMPTPATLSAGEPTGPDATFALDDVMRRMQQGMGQQATADDGAPPIHVIAGDEPDDAPDVYATFDAAYKMEIALQQSFTSGAVSKDVADALKNLLTPQAIASFVTFTGAAIAASIAGGPIGWAIDSVGLLILYLTLGESFFDFWSILFNDVSKATNKRQFDLAVKKLAATMTELGVQWLTVFFTTIAHSFASGGEGATTDGPAPRTEGPAPTDGTTDGTTTVGPPPAQEAPTLPPQRAPESPSRIARAGAETNPLPSDAGATRDVAPGAAHDPASDGGEPFNPIDDGPWPQGPTKAGRPQQAQLDASRQRADARNAANEPFINDNERQIYGAARKSLAKGPDQDTIYEKRPGEDDRVAARRYAREHSLPPEVDPGVAEVNLNAARHQLEDVVTGKGAAPIDSNSVRTIYDQYRKHWQMIKNGMAQYPDYWERMPPDTREILQRELELGETQDLDYWERRLQEYLDSQPPADGATAADAAAGAAAAGGISGAAAAAGASGAAGLGVGGTAIGGVPAAIGRRSGDGWQRAAAIGVAALLVVGVGGATALGYGPFAGKPVSVTESQSPGATATASQGAVGETQVAISEEPTEAPTPEPTPSLDLGKIQWSPVLQATTDQIPGNPHCRILVGIDVNFIALGSDGDEDQALIDAIVGKTAVVTMSGPDLPHQITVAMVRQGSNVGKFGDITAATGGATYQATVVSVGNIQLNVKSDTFVNPCNN
ncbi:MAG TPA: hypothetical protein VFW20_04000 [Candidatus Limnocylindrales bacterium]|nr:hypothetical protein [Candidatus Limnocylindrales bacterium]